MTEIQRHELAGKDRPHELESEARHELFGDSGEGELGPAQRHELEDPASVAALRDGRDG